MKEIILIGILISLCYGTAIAGPRYVSLAPSTTEILFALGLNEETVMVDENPVTFRPCVLLMSGNRQCKQK